MEELVSTEALEREILEDARKKAERMLRGAEDEARRAAAEGERRRSESVAELERGYAAKAERYRAESLARLPLERSRLKASLVDERLRRALEGLFSTLPEARVEALVAASLAGARDFLGRGELKARRKGLGEAAARRAVSAALPSARLAELVEDASLPAAGLVVESADGRAVMRATLDLVSDELLGRRRGELAAALCAEAMAL